MTRRLLALAAVATLAAAPAALADGDPASDYLISQHVFVPFDAKISPARATQLQAIVDDATRRGFTVRVALIATRFDLGAVPSLWRRPQPYARFLGQELFFAYKDRLLVVMPNGYGVSRRGKPLPAAQRLADSLPEPGAGGERLAAAAVVAVQRLAAQAGVAVSVPPLRAPAAPSNDRDRLVILLVVLAVSGAAAVFYALRRLRA